MDFRKIIIGILIILIIVGYGFISLVNWNYHISEWNWVSKLFFGYLLFKSIGYVIIRN
jgi:hypothetical protein